MSPFNTNASCFEKQITLKTKKGSFKTGGIVMISASEKPALVKTKTNDEDKNNLLNPSEFYGKELENKTAKSKSVFQNVKDLVKPSSSSSTPMIHASIFIFIVCAFVGGYFVYKNT